MTLACPACGTKARATHLQGVSCAACDDCGGHFIPGETLDRFLLDRDVSHGYRRIRERALEGPASARNLTCPACRAQSFHIVSSGLLAIDVCDLCVGVYLDKGEASAFLMQTRATTKVWEKSTHVVDTADAANDVADVVITIINLFH